MKREFIQIRCSIYEKKLLKKRAAKAGISLSDTFVPLPSKEILLKELLPNNWNFTAYSYNTKRTFPESAACLKIGILS